MAIVYGLKVNLSVTMVAMLNHTAIVGNKAEDTQSGQCDPPDGQSTTKPEDGPFDWSEPLQGMLLGCYFWGYLVSQIPLAYLAENYSAKWVFFFSVVLNVVCTILTPPLTKLHYAGLLTMRVLEGIAGGASFPAMHIMIANWAPQTERMLIATIIYVGTSAGTASSILMSGLVSNKYGWEWVFYTMGGLSCIWIPLWIILIQDDPNKQRFISPEERDMINTSLGHLEGAKEHPALPIAKVLKSIPFLAILISHTCHNFGWYMFLIEIPFYMKQVLKFNVSSNAALSALPYIPYIVFSILLGKTLDHLQNKGKLNRTVARKIANTFSTLVPAAALTGLCFIGCRHYFAVAFMCIGIVAMGAAYSGSLSSHMDIAPKYAGMLMGMTNTVATIPGITVAQLVGYITEGNQTIAAWRTIFSIAIVLLLIEFLVYTIFGSSEKQDWNDG
ncbi:sialin-like [Drosophila innubila]|uniref:sialin-like n=1 Tax=Drosophila innubila TaxID=198719 RepID=UPI00148D6202|nr:sialin-like [Drosophila innubila]